MEKSKIYYIANNQRIRINHNTVLTSDTITDEIAERLLSEQPGLKQFIYKRKEVEAKRGSSKGN